MVSDRTLNSLPVDKLTLGITDTEIKENIVSLWTYNRKAHFYTNCKCSKGLI